MSSTSDVEPGEAPIAVDSPHSVLGKQDLRGSHGSGAVIQVGAPGWLIALTSVSITLLIVLLVFGTVYIDARVQAGVADANATAKLARAEASVARDKVEDLRVKLGEKGIHVGPLDGH